MNLSYPKKNILKTNLKNIKLKLYEHYSFFILNYIHIMNLFINADPTVFRKNIKTYFERFTNEKIASNIEISIFNYAIKEAKIHRIICKWKNKGFCDIYSGRLRTIIYNLNNSPDLLDQIINKQISPTSLSNMTHQEMSPQHWKPRIERKMTKDKSRLTTNIEASTDLFTCKKCKSKKCTYYELQTRSADEPATIFITCVDCGKNWKN